MVFSDPRLKALDQLYAVYDQFTGNRNVACQKFCADCCTCNVTLTGLEAARITAGLDENTKQAIRWKLTNLLARPRFIPEITINRLADICAQGGEPPEEVVDPAWGACPLLENKSCPIYDVRPFGCRCMTSFQKCSDTGVADIDDFSLTVNHVFLQLIEHMDKNGSFGNISDMLADVLSGGAVASKTRSGSHHSPRLIPNSPLNTLLIPPGHREKIQPILAALRTIQI
ncbi:MAG: YkgJ family cysteine cluster protein [Desulfobacteraceae bacterium]|nr:YkgJ family cysteine cluster protein [Desulfobacteraceae bacterium]